MPSADTAYRYLCIISRRSITAVTSHPTSSDPPHTTACCLAGGIPNARHAPSGFFRVLPLRSPVRSVLTASFPLRAYCMVLALPRPTGLLSSPSYILSLVLISSLFPILAPPGQDTLALGVFDGHSGAAAAQYAQEKVLGHIKVRLGFVPAFCCGFL